MIGGSPAVHSKDRKPSRLEQNTPPATMKLLRHPADFADGDSLQRQIAETLEYIQAR
jgi:hypothetical protein